MIMRSLLTVPVSPDICELFKCHENDVPRWWLFTYKFRVQTFVMSVRFLMVKVVLEQIFLVIFHIFTY